METRMRFEGIISPVTTPFLADGSIDRDGLGAIRTEECIDYALAAKREGADAILVGSPYYAVPTQLELAQHALAIDRAANLPIMLYNYPGRTGTLMSEEF